MKRYFRYIREDKLISRLFVIAFLLNILNPVYILFYYSKLPPLLPLLNQLPWGEKRLSETWGIFIPSALVFIILVFNILISSLSYSRSPLLSRMFAVTSFLIALLSLLFIFRTIQLIT